MKRSGGIGIGDEFHHGGAAWLVNHHLARIGDLFDDPATLSASESN